MIYIDGTEKTVIRFIALFASLLLLPISAPIIISKNVSGCADKCSGLPGIQTGGGVVSGIAAFAYVIVGVSMIGGFTIAAGGGAGSSGVNIDDTGSEETTGTLESTPMPSPALSTASEKPEPTPTSSLTASPTRETETGTATETETPSSTATPVPTTTETAASTPTTTPTPTVTDNSANNFTDLTEAELEAREYRYREYMDSYTNLSETEESIEERDYTVDASNRTVTFIYKLNNSDNGSEVGRVAFVLMAHYSGLTESVGNDSNLGNEWVPKELQFRVLTTEGELHHTSNVSFMRAWRYNQEISSTASYYLSYYYNQEYGPAHHRYEENQTATPNSIDRTAP